MEFKGFGYLPDKGLMKDTIMLHYGKRRSFIGIRPKIHDILDIQAFAVPCLTILFKKERKEN